LAAATNLISDCEQFDARFRYDDQFGSYTNHSEMCERSWRLPGPPWEHLDRYVRNSLLFAVMKIAAPVLMLHGDQDFVHITQAEEMFSALRRAGKTAEFVRYWGEGYILSNPANIRDAWDRIFRWLHDLSPLP
jgi:dipeptidyl aminopeptidase/acylaminoacyl peptidase